MGRNMKKGGQTLTFKTPSAIRETLQKRMMERGATAAQLLCALIEMPEELMSQVWPTLSASSAESLQPMKNANSFAETKPAECTEWSLRTAPEIEDDVYTQPRKIRKAGSSQVEPGNGLRPK
jgi:hypothetical protein